MQIRSTPYKIEFSEKQETTLKVLGSDFYWNTIVEKDGVLYRLEFDHFTKRIRWVKIQIGEAMVVKIQ